MVTILLGFEVQKTISTNNKDFRTNHHLLSSSILRLPKLFCIYNFQKKQLMMMMKLLISLPFKQVVCPPNELGHTAAVSTSSSSDGSDT